MLRASLPKININDENFDTLVYESMRDKRGFIVTGLGEKFTQDVSHLYKSYDDFRSKPKEVKEFYNGTKEGLSGYFAPDQYKFGGKATTERFFINRNKQNQLTY